MFVSPGGDIGYSLKASYRDGLVSALSALNRPIRKRPDAGPGLFRETEL